jgi:chromate reductase
MKIVAFAGSNAEQSVNKKLIHYAATYFENDEVEILDLNDYEMPIFKPEREAAGIPQLAIDFAKKIDASDLILMSLAEYNSTYTAAFKNIFDWVSRVKDRKHFGEKPMFLMSAAPGPGGGKNVTEAFLKRAPFSGTTVLENFILPKFKDNFEEGKGIINPELKEEFEQKINSVKSQVK